MNMDTNNDTDDLGFEPNFEDMLTCIIGDLTQKTVPDYEKAYIEVQNYIVAMISVLDKQIEDGAETINIKNVRNMISEVFITVHKNLKFNKDYQKEKKEYFKEEGKT